MKSFLFALAITILLVPIGHPLQAQDGGFGGGDSIDITGALNNRGGGRGGNGGFNNNAQANVQIPESKVLFSDIQSALKKGKTPLDKSQEKPLRSMLDLEVVTLADRVQLLRSNNSNSPDGGRGFPGGGDFQRGGDFQGGPGFPGGADFGTGFPRGGDFQRGGNNGTPGTPDAAGGTNTNALANSLAAQTETITSLKNDDFLENKMSAFLSPEQIASILKTKAADKENTTCLGGLFDRVSNGIQNNNGRGNNNRGNFNFNNNARKANGQAYCMTAEATASDRLEPIRKELAKANLPMGKDKEPIAEIFIKSQIKDLEEALRTTLTSNFSGNRGGGATRSSNPQLVIQSGTDDIYNKASAMLNPAQAESLKKWNYERILGRGGIEALIAVEAMQGTPLTDEQISRVTAAWPEVRNQLQSTSKASNKNLSAKDLDSGTVAKILAMLEPAQAAAYEVAKKYGNGK